jgi:hypothetical protein
MGSDGRDRLWHDRKSGVEMRGLCGLVVRQVALIMSDSSSMPRWNHGCTYSTE